MTQNIDKDTQDRLKKQPQQSQDNINRKNRGQMGSSRPSGSQQSAQNFNQGQQGSQQSSSRKP